MEELLPFYPAVQSFLASVCCLISTRWLIHLLLLNYSQKVEGKKKRSIYVSQSPCEDIFMENIANVFCVDETGQKLVNGHFRELRNVCFIGFVSNKTSLLLVKKEMDLNRLLALCHRSLRKAEPEASN